MAQEKVPFRVCGTVYESDGQRQAMPTVEQWYRLPCPIPFPSVPQPKLKTSLVQGDQRQQDNEIRVVKYRVRIGDTLGVIARDFSGDGARWNEILQANSRGVELRVGQVGETKNTANPKGFELRVGQVINLPYSWFHGFDVAEIDPRVRAWAIEKIVQAGKPETTFGRARAILDALRKENRNDETRISQHWLVACESIGIHETDALYSLQAWTLFDVASAGHSAGGQDRSDHVHGHGAQKLELTVVQQKAILDAQRAAPHWRFSVVNLSHSCHVIFGLSNQSAFTIDIRLVAEPAALSRVEDWAQKTCEEFSQVPGSFDQVDGIFHWVQQLHDIFSCEWCGFRATVSRVGNWYHVEVKNEVNPGMIMAVNAENLGPAILAAQAHLHHLHQSLYGPPAPTADALNNLHAAGPQKLLPGCSTPGDKDSLKIFDVGTGVRIAFDRDGKLAPFPTQLALNAPSPPRSDVAFIERLCRILKIHPGDATTIEDLVFSTIEKRLRGQFEELDNTRSKLSLCEDELIATKLLLDRALKEKADLKDATAEDLRLAQDKITQLEKCATELHKLRTRR